MIIRNPYDRDDLNIGKKDRVLEVGSGHNPTYRADVIVEQYMETNYHRCGNLKIYPHQDFINANGEVLPFKDKEFDYVICNQVLEHVENAEYLREDIWKLLVCWASFFFLKNLINGLSSIWIKN